MARIPESEIERLKREISVERLAEARGVKLKRHGADLIGLCPFHDDHEPSLVITPSKNLWNCLGACRRGGDVIAWVMQSEGVSFRHAVELLREDLPLGAINTRPGVQRSTVPKLPVPVERNADDHALLQQVVSFYHETLKQSPDALKYLAARGLESSEMIEHFRLGYANRTIGYRLPASNRAAGAELRGRLQKLGLYRETGHEHFNGSVVVPIFNLEADVMQMYGRKITRGLRDGTPLHLYLPGPHRGVWNEEALAASKEIILCEALIDGLTFWCAGYRHVTTSYGVNGFTEEIKAAFRKHGTKKIYIAYDRDEAGEDAAHEHAAELMSMGIECFRVQFPKSMDANEYALKVQPAPKSLGVLLNRAEWLGKGKRPVTTVIEQTMKQEPQPPAIEEVQRSAASEEQIEPAAKEDAPKTNPVPLEEKIPEPVPSLVAEAAKEKISAEEPISTEPLPSALSTTIEVPTEIRGEEIIMTQGNRRYRVRGLGKNMSHGLLKVNILVSSANARGEFVYHGDTFDLNLARQRTVFVKQAAEELGIKEEIIRHDLGRVWLKLEELQDEQIQKALEPEKKQVEMSVEEKAAALDLLRDPRLLERILGDFERCGVVGEETNKKIGYLAAVSRLLDTPLAVMVQSASAAGKTALMEAVLALMPEEHRVQYSAMTGQSLFYMGQTDLKNKVLALVEEEGAQRAAYALKLLQSEGALTIASTGKDPTSGRLVTHEYRVEGPVMIFLTTTAIDIDEELLNRCLVLTVDEDRAQTQAIHRMQREAQTLAGLRRKTRRAAILKLHRNAQRLLKPIHVVNPHADDLTFPDSLTRTRRDHMKYLTLIRAITLLYQYQRPIQREIEGERTLEYIESTLDDVKLAEELIKPVLGRSLDELPPQTRRLLLLIEEMVSRACAEQKIERQEYRFSRRDVRARTRWGDTQLKIHLHRLEELEYLIVHRGGRGQSFVYELIEMSEGDKQQPFLPGLIEIEKLKISNYDTKKSGVKEEKPGSSRPQVGGMSVGSRGEESPAMTRLRSDFYENPRKNTSSETEENGVVVVPVLASKANGTAAAGVK
jgi:DNA primase